MSQAPQGHPKIDRCPSSVHMLNGGTHRIKGERLSVVLQVPVNTAWDIQQNHGSIDSPVR